MKFSPYPKYKDSGSAVGNIPDGWRTARLRYVAELCYGDSLPNEQRIEGEIPVFGSNGPVGTHLSANTSAPVIVVGRKGSFGKVAYSPHAVFAIDTTYFIDSRHTSSDLRWLYYSLQTLNLDVFSQDTGVPGLSREDAYSRLLAIPSRSDQSLIASFLDRETAKIDTLIAKQEKLIELLKEKRQAVVSHAVTKGLDPTVPMKPSGVEWLGDVPKHWTMTRIRFLFRQEKRQDQIGKPVLSVYRDYGVILKTSRDDNMNKTPEDLSAYQLVNPNDLVVNKMKAWQGSLGISDFEGITSPDYVVFSPRHRESSVFLHLLFRSAGMVTVYRSISNGIRPAQWRLEPDLFLSLPVFLPPLQEQLDLVSFITDKTSQFDTLIAKAEQAIALQKEHRTALISAAVTGKIDVREAASELQEAA